MAEVELDPTIPLTSAQLFRIHRFTGDQPTDAAIQTAWASGRNFTLRGLTLEILDIRLANLIAHPVQFVVTGEYAQNVRYNIVFLQGWVNMLRANIISPDNPDATQDVALVRFGVPRRTKR